jgi:hypothetical protein
MQYDEVYEGLAALYLRLSGYFTTGLILHSDRNGNRGEIDWLAVRHPFHDQAARGVDIPAFLALQDKTTDVIFCEVKSSNVGFNNSIRTPETVEDALQWAGVFPPAEVSGIVDQFLPLLEDSAPLEKVREGVTKGTIRIRPLLCCPSLSATDTTRWCLTGDEIMRFLDECLDPSKAPKTCKRKYGYELWGHSFESIVRWFKTRKKSEPLTVEALLKYLR